jgi:hypothetical protein
MFVLHILCIYFIDYGLLQVKRHKSIQEDHINVYTVLEALRTVQIWISGL